MFGFCNPSRAGKRVQPHGTSPRASVTFVRHEGLLPCNVIVQEAEGGGTEVAAVDPAVSMQAVGNPALAGVAEQVRSKLRRVVERVD